MIELDRDSEQVPVEIDTGSDDFLLEASLAFVPPEGTGPRRFTMKAYDGGLLRVANQPHPVVVDLKGTRAVDQVKALLHHDANRPAGHMDRVVIGNSIETEGLLSVPENAAKVIEAQQNGFEWEASVGMTIEAGAKELVPAGKTVNVNGRNISGPVIVARKTLLREVSFTGAGAGENTSARIAAAAVSIPDSQQAESMPDTSPTTTTTTPAPTPVPVSPEVSKELGELRELRASLTTERDALKTERENMQRDRLVASVDRLCAQYGDPGEDIRASLTDKAKSGAIAESEIELTILRASGGRKLGGFQPIGGKSGAPATQQVLEAALCMTNGWDEKQLDGHFDEKTINAAMANRFSGFGPRALCIEFLNARGHHVAGGKLQDEDIQAAIGLAEQDVIQASGGMSTISLPGVLGNVARKESLRAFDAFTKAIVTIAKRSTASDYKPYYMYRVSTGALLEQVGADGELKSMDLKEDPFQARVYPFGRKIALTAVMLKNDDMGVFNDLAILFGLTAARTLEFTGFKTLLSDQANFWTTAKKNRLASGGGSALGLTSLDAAYQLFLEMKDFTGQPIGIEPKYLLCAPGDRTTANTLNTSTTINVAATGNTDAVVMQPTDNPWKGMFTPMHSPYLANGMVPNANGTQWGLFPDPTITSPLVVSYLDGKATPQIKTWEAIPGKMGMQWDATFNFGFNLHDDTGSVFSPGQ